MNIKEKLGIIYTITHCANRSCNNGAEMERVNAFIRAMRT